MKQSGVILAALIGLLVVAAPTKADEQKTGDDELHRNEQGSADATELTTPANKGQNPLDNTINNRINDDMPNSDGPGQDQWQQQQQQQDASPNMGDLFQFGRMPSLLPSLFDAPIGPGGFGGRHGPSGRLGGFDLSGGLFGRNGPLGSNQLSPFESPLLFDPLPFGRTFHRTLNEMHRNLAKEFEGIERKPGETPVSKQESTFWKNGVKYRKQVIIFRLDPNQPMAPENKQIDQQQELQEQQPPQQQEQQQQQEPASPTVVKLR